MNLKTRRMIGVIGLVLLAFGLSLSFAFIGLHLIQGTNCDRIGRSNWSRTTNQASNSSTDHGGGKRRCGMDGRGAYRRKSFFRSYVRSPSGRNAFCSATNQGGYLGERLN
jgi:hypothetical protein